MSSTLFATSVADLAPLTVAIPFGLAAVLASRLPFPFSRRHAELVAAAGALAVAVLCVLLLREALDSHGPVVTRLGGWEPRDDGVIVGINFAVRPARGGARACSPPCWWAWRWCSRGGSSRPSGRRSTR